MTCILDCQKFLPTTDAEEQLIKHRLLDHAATLGPFVTAMAKSLWVESVLDALSRIQNLLALAPRYGHQRLDAACRRALYYRSIERFVVEQILNDDLQELPLSPYTDVFGQLLLPEFVRPTTPTRPRS